MSDYALISVQQFYQKINCRLDTKIGINKVYALVKSPGFPSIKVGNSYYVIEDKVQEWMDSFAKRNKRL